MKGFLLDENLPSRLQFTPGLPVIAFPQVSRHPSDSDLWHFARWHELVIVSKDADFSDRIIMQTPPPWVVFDEGVEHDSRGGCAPRFQFRRGNGARGSAHDAWR